MNTPEQQKYVSNGTLQLELKAFRSEVRLWLVVAIIGNQLVAHVALPPAVGFAGGIIVVCAILAKVVLFR